MQIAIICIVFLVVISNAVLGLGAVIVLLIGYRQLFSTQVSILVEKNGLTFAVILPTVVFIIIEVLRSPIASDDLLRNIIIGPYYQFNYQKLYPISSLPNFSLWWGFDHALAWMQNFMSPKAVMWSLQGAIYLAISLIMTAAASQFLQNREDKYYWVGAVVAIAIFTAVGRIALARPEIILAVWGLSAILVRRNWHVIIWSLVGVALTTTYWLAFLYFFSTILFHTPIRHKVTAAIVLFLLHSFFWFGMFGTGYSDALVWLPEVMKNQICAVGENIGLEQYLLNPIFVTLVIASSAGVLVSKRMTHVTELALLTAFFISANQVRYIGVIGPLLVLLTLACWKNWLPRLNILQSVLLTLGCLFLTINSAGRVPSEKDAPHFTIPINSRVIGAEANYFMPFFNPGIQVEPSYAFGAAPKDVQLLAVEINKGDPIDCAIIRKYHFTHLVEKTLSGQLPACLTLQATYKEWRLWNVR